MISTIAAALLPILFMLALGYGAGRAHAFPKDAVAVITELVLDFALSASLFVGTVTVSRDALLSEGPIFISFLIVVVVTWAAIFAIGRWLFRHDVQEASIQALLIALPAVPFYGIAMMPQLYGNGAEIGVSIGAIVVNVVAVPATTIALSITGASDTGNAKPGGSATVRAVANALFTALKAPYIVAPLLGVALVLFGFRLPALVTAPLQLAAQGSSSVGLFVAGLTLASIAFKMTWETAFNLVAKLVAMPALFLGVAAIVGANAPTTGQGVFLASLPCGPIAVLLATRHKKYQVEASTALAITTLGFIVTLPILLALFHPSSG